MVTCFLPNTKDWYAHLDQEMCTGIVFVDLKKAFDMVDHVILIGNLSHYGIKDTDCKLFLSYLGKRRQCCRVNGITSNVENITCGVPQGSCHGPLLFLLYNILIFSSMTSLTLLSSWRYAILQTAIFYFLVAILLKLLPQVFKKICLNRCIGFKTSEMVANASKFTVILFGLNSNENIVLEVGGRVLH